MSRSKTGPLPDKAFENDIPPQPHVDQNYSAPFLRWRDELIAKIKSSRK